MPFRRYKNAIRKIAKLDLSTFFFSSFLGISREYKKIRQKYAWEPGGGGLYSSAIFLSERSGDPWENKRYARDFFSKKGERDKRSRRERMKDWGGGGHENQKRGRKGKLWAGKESRVRPSILSWHGCQKALSPGGQREGGGDAARRQLHFSLATRQGYKPAGTAKFLAKFKLPYITKLGNFSTSVILYRMQKKKLLRILEKASRPHLW